MHHVFEVVFVFAQCDKSNTTQLNNWRILNTSLNDIEGNLLAIANWCFCWYAPLHATIRALVTIVILKAECHLKDGYRINISKHLEHKPQLQWYRRKIADYCFCWYVWLHVGGRQLVVLTFGPFWTQTACYWRKNCKLLHIAGMFNYTLPAEYCMKLLSF